MHLRQKRGGEAAASTSPRQWAIDLSVGAAVLTVGAGGVLTLLVSAGLASKSVWDAVWWLAAISLFGALALVGLYMLAAVYFPWPLPETRAAREARAELQFGTIRTFLQGGDFAVVEVPVSVGRLDIDNASINVLVPDLVTIAACNRDGAVVALPDASMEHTPESLYPDGDHESNFWQQSRLHLSAFTNVPFYFRLGFQSGSDPLPLPFRFAMTAAALHGRVQAEATLASIRSTQDAG